MVNNKSKYIQKPLMEDLYIGNLTNDTTEEEISAPPGIRRYYTLSREQLGEKAAHKQWEIS